MLCILGQNPAYNSEQENHLTVFIDCENSMGRYSEMGVSALSVYVPDDAFEPKHVKARITMWIGMDLLEEAKKRGSLKDLPYQTYLNQVLRNVILDSSEDEKIRRLIRQELAKTGT